MPTLEFSAPEDAVIVSGVGVPAPILGGESATPGGVTIYGGADLPTFMSADGVLYVPYCGERTGQKFGTYCFRVHPSGQAEWVDLPAFTEGRPGATLEADGLWLSWPNERGNRITRIQVPGFITPGFPSSGRPAPPPPPIVAQPPPQPSTSNVDAEARAAAAEVRRELGRKIADLGAEVAALEARPGGGLNESQVRDVIWNGPTVDRIYAELATDRGGLVDQVRRIARAVVPATAAAPSTPAPAATPLGGATEQEPPAGPLPEREALKGLIREVLRELLA